MGNFGSKRDKRDSNPPPSPDEPKVIVCVGPYGCGKSKFMDCLTNTNWTNNSLSPALEVRSFKVQRNHKTVILVDTPGFDKENYIGVMNLVISWVENSTDFHGAKVAGILYLHRIIDRRLTVPPPTRHLTSLCENPGKQIAFVTTHWDVAGKTGQMREDELRHNQHIKSLLNLGVQMCRFVPRAIDPWTIVDPFLT